jgi:hypothetical protein
MARNGDLPSIDGTFVYAMFVKQRGAPASVVEKLASTPPETMSWLSQAELRQWNTTIVDGNDAILDRPRSFSLPAVAWPSVLPSVENTGMLPLLLLSLLMIAAPVYRVMRRPTGPNLLNRSGKNDPHRRS